MTGALVIGRTSRPLSGGRMYEAAAAHSRPPPAESTIWPMVLKARVSLKPERPADDYDASPSKEP
jgi:hypothetical protein